MEDRLIGGEEEDSDRPDWAGPGATGETPGSRNPTPGIAKGDLYGDLYIVLRDEDGVPILSEAGYVQPIDADGNLIPLDAEGEVAEEYAALLQEVDLGRLNVGRAPERVLDNRLEEAVANLNATDPGTVISVDASGRLTYVIDGELLTIDSPLENLALYLDLMDDGVIDGLTAALDPALQPMVTDGLTNDDLVLAASLFAAAADKTGTLTVDEVVYMNSVLGVTGVEPTVVDGVAYVDYSDFTYDRADTWSEVTAEVLVYDATTASWTAQTVDLLDAVFDGADAAATNVAGFTLAADDALQVIEFVHEYEVPELPITESLGQ